MSKHAPWKDLERRAARYFPGGVRLWRPDFSDSQPDGECPTDVWDSKCFKRFSVIELFVKCERKYRAFANGRRFSLVLFSREHPRAGDFLLVRAKDWKELLEIEQRWKEKAG